MTIKMNGYTVEVVDGYQDKTIREIRQEVKDAVQALEVYNKHIVPNKDKIETVKEKKKK